MDNPELAKLIRRTADGDIGALESIFRAMKDGIYSFALITLRNRQAAEDIVQETMLEIYRSASHYQNTGSARSWVLTIARNCAVDAVRKACRETDTAIPEESISDIAAPARNCARCWRGCPKVTVKS